MVSFLGCFREIYLNCCQQFVQEAQRLIMGKHEIPVAKHTGNIATVNEARVINEERRSVALIPFRH